MKNVVDEADVAVLFYKKIIQEELYESKKNEKEKYQVDQRQKLVNIKEELYDLKKRNDEADEIEKLDIDDFC
jgi:hypothetical protein